MISMKNGKGMEKMDVESRIERSLPNWPRTVQCDILVRLHESGSIRSVGAQS